MDEYNYLFLLMAVSASAVAALNIALVIRLRELHAEAFAESGRPSAFYFAGIQWMFNSKFFNWLWSAKHEVLADDKLTLEIFWLRGCWIVFHVGWLLSIAHR